MRTKWFVFVLLAIAAGAMGCAASGTSPAGEGAPPVRLPEPTLIAGPPATSDSSLATTPLKGQPRIVFEREAYDFGKVVYGKMVEAVFRFRNEGTAPLVIQPPILRVVEGC